MKFSMRQILLLTIGTVLGIGLSVGGSVMADRQAVEERSLPLTELRTFSEIFGKIKADYVKDIEDKELLENAIRGMLTGLDPHSSYLDKDEFKDLQVGTSGEFGGLGIEVTMEDGFVKVVAPIDDTPAQRAGIQAGDLIIRLDDQSVKGLSLNEAVNIMRGKPGSDITLTVVREGAEKPLKITITRDKIQVKSVKSRTLEPGYIYVRITNFQQHTGEHLKKAVAELRKENEGKVKGMILDLRNNPGGVLGAAVEVSDAFLDKGTIVYTEGRAKDSELRFNATPEDIVYGAPLVVLINGGSASASEIVAGALQDHKRAILMGTRSFGKGSVQTIFPMSNDTAVKLTTALYFTPAGRSIQAEGIEPDISLEAYKLAKTETSDLQPIKEADLSGHLSNGNGKDGTVDKDKESKSKGAEDKPKLAEEDYALHEALTLLKGLNILQSRGEP